MRSFAATADGRRLVAAVGPDHPEAGALALYNAPTVLAPGATLIGYVRTDPFARAPLPPPPPGPPPAGGAPPEGDGIVPAAVAAVGSVHRLALFSGSEREALLAASSGVGHVAVIPLYS